MFHVVKALGPMASALKVLEGRGLGLKIFALTTSLINLDPDIYRFCQKMLCIHYFEGISNFGNANKSPKIPYSAIVMKMEK